MFATLDNGLATMTVTCCLCGRTRAYTVTAGAYLAYTLGNVPIQDSLRDLDPHARSLISSEWCGLDLKKGLLCRKSLLNRIKAILSR